jgi:cobalt-zinc-cadmium efflux system protein
MGMPILRSQFALTTATHRHDHHHEATRDGHGAAQCGSDDIGGHAHGRERVAALTERVLWAALLATGGFALIEAIGGHFAGSLALLSDAGHMATDAAAFIVALVAHAVSQRPPSEGAS